MSIQISDALKIRDLPENGERGVFATRGISPGECLLAVPFSSLLTVASPLQCTSELQQKAHTLCGFLGRLTREDDALALRLLWEKHEMGQESRWAKHMAVLPVSYPHVVVGWTEEELEGLTGSNVKLVAERWRLQVLGDFESLSKLSLPEEMGMGGTLETHFPWFDLEGYKWALGSVWSRCCSVELNGQLYKAMGPFFDLFNHQVNCDMEHGLRMSSEPLQGHPAGDACLTIVSRQAWGEGEQVCINYGPEDNGRLLTLYGFCCADNPHDKVELWATFSEQAPYYARKQQILLEHGIQNTAPFTLTLSDPLPQKLVATLRIQRMSEEDLASASRAFDPAPFSPENEAMVLEALQQALGGMYHSYLTSIQEDETTIASAVNEHNESSVNPHAIMAAQLRVGEKRILRAALEAVAVRQQQEAQATQAEDAE